MILEINCLYIMDCLDLMKRMDSAFVDLTVTSPPYADLRTYNGYSFDFHNIAKELYRITKEGGIVVWVVGDKIDGGFTLTTFRQGIFFQEIGFRMHDVMIYKKKNTPFMRTNAYTPCYEFMFVLCKGKPKTFNPLREPTKRSGFEMLPANKKPDGSVRKVLGELKKEKTRINIWEYAVGLGGSTSDKIAFKHPAIFPEKLAEEQILSWSNVGDLVFDPMCGSGTTCKVAKMLGRNYIGCDISKEYIQIAQQRLDMVKQKILMSVFNQP
jgi:DNA modification methylase